MSFWQYRIAAVHWIAAHDTGEGLSAAEADELWDWLQDKPATVRSLVH